MVTIQVDTEDEVFAGKPLRGSQLREKNEGNQRKS